MLCTQSGNQPQLRFAHKAWMPTPGAGLAVLIAGDVEQGGAYEGLRAHFRLMSSVVHENTQCSLGANTDICNVTQRNILGTYMLHLVEIRYV